jgi:hypothetical protein
MKWTLEPSLIMADSLPNETVTHAASYLLRHWLSLVACHRVRRCICWQVAENKLNSI